MGRLLVSLEICETNLCLLAAGNSLLQIGELVTGKLVLVRQKI